MHAHAAAGHDHAAFFRRSELAALMDVHLEASKENEDPLTEGETKIIKGCLKMREKTIGDVMTTLENVYMLPSSTRLNDDQMSEVRMGRGVCWFSFFFLFFGF